MLTRETLNRARKRLGLRPLDEWRKEQNLVRKAKPKRASKKGKR